VTELLERVLETMQLYQGAPSDTHPTSAARADGEADPDRPLKVGAELRGINKYVFIDQ
jgi:hypothetical protein